MIRAIQPIALSILLIGCGGSSTSDLSIVDAEPVTGSTSTHEPGVGGGATEDPVDSVENSQIDGSNIDDTDLESNSTSSGLVETDTLDTDISDNNSLEADVIENDTNTQPDPITSQAFGRDWDTSPYDHGGEEISTSAPRILTGTTNEPIRYQNVFDRERELFDYKPRFIPSRPYFDKYNLPWIYVSNMNQLGGPDPASPIHVSATTDQPTGKPLTSLTYSERIYVNRYSDDNPCTRCDSYILRLNTDGKWVSASIKAMAEEFGFDSFSQGPGSGPERRVEQIYFQNNGDVFLKATHGVLHYRASRNDWYGYPSRFINNTLMAGDGKRPPLFMTHDSSLNRYLVRQLIGDTELNFRTFEIAHGQQLDLDRANQPVVWEGNTIHIAAFNHSNTIMNRQPHNSAQTYVRYNMDTGETDTLFMGWSGSPSQVTADNHNFPSLLIDSEGYLHYLSGAHNHQLWHRRSLVPVTDEGWNNSRGAWGDGVSADDKFTPGPNNPVAQFAVDSSMQEDVTYVGNPMDQYTFPSIRIDGTDTIHISVLEDVPRNVGGDISKKLTYLKGTPTDSGDYTWIDKGTLIAPNWNLFSAYRQKTTIDRKNNIYVSYAYEIQNFRTDTWYDQENRIPFDSLDKCLASTSTENCINVVDAHRQRWPDEALGGFESRLTQDHTHDLVLIGSDDGGETWTITTTEELLARRQESNEINVVGY